jgi:histidine triad (HIT) family protein
MPECIFCKIINGEITSKEVYRDEKFYAFDDINPQAPVHILIVPKKHIAKLHETDDKNLLGEMILLACKIAGEKGLTNKGYRIIINTNKQAGQSVDHIHLHLLGGRIMNWPPG